MGGMECKGGFVYTGEWWFSSSVERRRASSVGVSAAMSVCVSKCMQVHIYVCMCLCVL